MIQIRDSIKWYNIIFKVRSYNIVKYAVYQIALLMNKILIS